MKKTKRISWNVDCFDFLLNEDEVDFNRVLELHDKLVTKQSLQDALVKNPKLALLIAQTDLKNKHHQSASDTRRMGKRGKK